MTLGKSLNVLGNPQIHQPGQQPSVESEQGDLRFISVSEVAINRIRELMKQEGKKGGYLRVRVRAGGCAGYSYEMNIEDGVNEGDLVRTIDGVNLVVDLKSLQLIGGLEIDYKNSLKESGFKFTNPNAKGSCGCGKSFN